MKKTLAVSIMAMLAAVPVAMAVSPSLSLSPSSGTYYVSTPGTGDTVNVQLRVQSPDSTIDVVEAQVTAMEEGTVVMRLLSPADEQRVLSEETVGRELLRFGLEDTPGNRLLISAALSGWMDLEPGEAARMTELHRRTGIAPERLVKFLICCRRLGIPWSERNIAAVRLLAEPGGVVRLVRALGRDIPEFGLWPPSWSVSRVWRERMPENS